MSLAVSRPGHAITSGRNVSAAGPPLTLGARPPSQLFRHAASIGSIARPARQARLACSAAAPTPADAPLAATSNILPLQEQFSSPQAQNFDFIVAGSGIAGLSYALKVAEFGRVAVVTKATANEGCTQYAQGGVCAVLDANDSVESHIRDTFVAGCFLNNLGAVEAVCREGPERVLELVAMGAEFTRDSNGELHLTREGGHAHRRIVHAADVTGREIERALLTAANAHPNITFFEHHLAVDLVTDEVNGVKHCLGMDVLDQHANSLIRFVAPVTMLATGGGGQVYPHTTNPEVSTGDGMAMAHRAKAAMANMEFVQFHPTSLWRPNAGAGRSFLISEAVRGEGGMLFNHDGDRFMEGYDKRLELAPRDVVARAIQDQMLSHGTSHVLLDISHKPAAATLSHFPNIAAKCAEGGIDITRDPIPVVPAQHYMCGGVQTALSGQTSVAGLFACGEVACTGLHGANRLASNSLLEGLVFAARAVQPSIAHLAAVRSIADPALTYAASRRDSGKVPQRLSEAASAWVAAKRSKLTNIMWNAAGIVRNMTDLKAALGELAALYVETKALFETYAVNTELVELRNLVTVAELIVSSALQRRESRGLHYCLDFPVSAAEEGHDTVIRTSFRRRFDMSQVTDSLATPRAGGTPISAIRRPSRAPTRVRDVALRSQKDEL